MGNKVCCRCKKKKQEVEFPFRSKSKDTRRGACIECLRVYQAEKARKTRAKSRTEGLRTSSSISRSKTRLEHQKKIFDYMMKNPCVDCGESNPVRLTFDHVRGEKSFTISNFLGHFKWETIEQEILKCDVRCANCHASKTQVENKRLGWFFESWGEQALKPWINGVPR